MVVTRKEVYALVLFISAVIVGAAYLHAVKLGAAESQLKQDVQQQISGLQKDLASELAKIKQDQKITQPAQIVQKLPQYIELPKPIIIAGPSTVPSTSAGQLPDAPSSEVAPGSLIVPAESIAAFWAHETDCKADSLKLQECSKELPLITHRAEQAEAAMKGGNFWSRVKANAKWFVVGAASGAAAGVILKH